MVVEYTDAGGASDTSTLVNVERSCVCNLNLSGIVNLRFVCHDNFERATRRKIW